jgi:DNA repair exonuclease SbcCD nuclease subunit
LNGLNEKDEYEDSHFSGVLNKVKGLQNSETLNFIFVTDPHHEPGENQLRAARVIRKLAGAIRPDFIVCGGDLSINGDKSAVLAAQKEFMSELSVTECPTLPVKGNHDDNTIYDFYRNPHSIKNVVFPNESFELGFSKLEGKVCFDEGNKLGMYYFYDIPVKKTRIIILNAIDIPYQVTDKGNLLYNGQFKYAFSDRQLQWTAHKALRFSEKSDSAGWRTILFSHVPILQEGLYGTDHGITNDTVMWDILKAFKIGAVYRSIPTTGDFSQSVEADFSGQGGGTLIACFFGHVHVDQSVQKDGITLVTTLNAATQQDFAETPARVSGTISETAFDIVTVDFSKQTIFTVRFGAGTDRMISF